MKTRGQSILEYTILIGIISITLFYMGTAIKRGAQSMVKVTADQVGSQNKAEQDFDSAQQGFLDTSKAYTNVLSNKQVSERIGVVDITQNETSETTVKTITNGGFSPD